jgi:apolipoprotein N-acyltransferase
MTNNAATVTITASSSATSYPALPRSPRFGGWWVLGASMLCLLLAALSRLCQGAAQAHPRNLRPMALVAILAALLLAGLSCGGGSSGGSGATTPPPESGTVTVTGTSTSTTHSAQISVSVS